MPISNAQATARLRQRNHQARAESAQLRTNLRKMRAAKQEALGNEDEAEALRAEADNILADYEDREDERYFRNIDPYADRREFTEISWVQTDQENSELLVLLDTEKDEHIRSRRADQ